MLADQPLSMTVEAIKDAIAGLPEDDRHSLANSPSAWWMTCCIRSLC